MIQRLSLPVVLLSVLAAGWAQLAEAAAPLDPQLIKALLRAGTEEQETFIDNVVIMTNAGLLPRSVVESSYYWAMRKPKRLRFEYFKHALLFRLDSTNKGFDFSTVNAPSALVQPTPSPKNRKRINAGLWPAGVGNVFSSKWAPWNWQ